MKRILFSIIIIGTIFSLFHNPITATLNNNQTPGQVIGKAFSVSGAELNEVKVEGWSKINQQFLTATELKELGWLVANTFTEDAQWHISSGEVAGQSQVEFTAQVAQEHYSILLQSFTTASDDGETYLIVSNQSDSYDDVVNLEYTVNNAFSPFETSARLAVLYVGQVKEKLDQHGKNQLVDSMLKAIKGKKVEGIEEDFLVSYSGYTPLIPVTWWTGAEDMNIQLAIRNHSHGDSTLVYVGYPLILTGY